MMKLMSLHRTSTRGFLNIFLRYVLFPVLFSQMISCSNHPSKTNLRNYYHNDLESYGGWLGISGYKLSTKDSHSGRHSFETNSTDAVYSMTFSKSLNELSSVPIRKFEMSIWVKTTNADSKGAYILSIEKGTKTLAYFSFAAESFVQSPDQWCQVKGVATLPADLTPDAIVKIYFWNKGPSVIFIDDFEFSFEN